QDAHGVARGEQGLGDVPADELRAAEDQDSSARMLHPKPRRESLLGALERVEPSKAEPRVVLDVARDDHEVMLERRGSNEEILDRLTRLAMLEARPATADRPSQGQN